MHHLLKRQLKRYLKEDLETLPKSIQDIFAIISDAYQEYDESQQMIERSLALSSEELTEQNRKLEIAKQNADQANYSKSAFLANMSHELRTPLNAIIGYSEILHEDLQETHTDPAILNDLNKIKDAGVHLLELINGVLDLSKIEAGKIELHIELFSIFDMIQSVKSIAEPLIGKENNKFILNVDDNLGSMYSDHTKLRQVLFNLLSNAAKFTSNGTISLTVTKKDHLLKFIVSDTGIGMDEEQQLRIFDAFEQADKSTTREYGGTGLGLTISKKFIELMGGHITLSSIKGKGSTFIIEIPETSECPTNIITHETKVDIAAHKHVDVLVIEDDPNTQELIKRILEKHHYTVAVASNGKEGLKMAETLLPKVITLDVKMPEVDGWETLSLLKKKEKLHKTPIVMISMIDEKATGIELGADHYLVKPFKKDDLVALVSRMVTIQKKSHILLLEQDVSTQILIRSIIEQDGWQVYSVQSTHDAIQLLHNKLVQSIIVDIPINDLDTILDELKLYKEKHNCLVILLCDTTLEPDTQKKIEHIIDNVIIKDTTSSRGQIVAQLRKLLK